MRFLVALCMLLVATCGAAANEPFGLIEHSASNLEVFRLQARFANDRDGLVARIVSQVRQEPKETWVTWTNQLANLANVGDCTPTAVLKFQVLLALGFARSDLRLVAGSEEGFQDNHMVAAINTEAGWRVLDNRHLVRNYSTPLDSQITKKFRAFVAFN